MARTVVDLIARAAARAPEHEAVCHESATRSYADLDIESRRIARALIEAGVAPGDRVGVYLDKTPEAVAALIAVMTAGGICVPLDPTGPVPRLARIVADCGLAVLISSGSKAARLDALLEEGVDVQTILCLGAKPLALSREDVRIVSAETVAATVPLEMAVPRIEDDLAYILYTSGSTGRPKGVMITHRNIVAFVEWATGYFDIRAGDRVSSHAPLQFDLSLFDLYVTLSAGATVCLVPQGIGFLAVDLASFIADQRITVWQSVPSVLMLINRILDGPRADFDALRLIFFAGEPYPPTALADLMRKIPQARYVNIYGATEINDVTAHEIETPPSGAALPIGRACDHMQVLVLDEDDRPVSEGVGELCARGPTVARGYWGDPEMSAQKFAQNPLHDAFFDPLYRTGDLVRVEADGLIHYVGRRDAQVKIRGYRINIREVEDALLTHAGISEVAVVDRETDGGGKMLAAFVATKAEVELTARQVKRHVAAALPNYMVPEEIVLASDLPKTATGKIDRVRLKGEGLAERTTQTA
ncbi:amino acid adenylation domain-containing protein [Stappia sp.]|uniref:amino acid adenylation domain-containing protein n=1 Tax=Stappia sp. TaxID=1870903 RepID=UPI0032D9764C